MAVATSGAFVVYGGGGPPEPCPAAGIVQVAKVNGTAHDEGGGGGGGVVFTVSGAVAN